MIKWKPWCYEFRFYPHSLEYDGIYIGRDQDSNEVVARLGKSYTTLTPWSEIEDELNQPVIELNLENFYYGNIEVRGKQKKEVLKKIQELAQRASDNIDGERISRRRKRDQETADEKVKDLANTIADVLIERGVGR